MSLRDLERPTPSRASHRPKPVPKELSPYRDIPYKQAPDGIRCHICNELRAIDLRLGICKWCVDAYVRDMGRRCFRCQEPSSRPLRDHLCVSCRGKGLGIPENLAALIKARYVGMIKG